MTLAASPSFGEPRRFPARLAALQEAIAFARETCAAIGIGADDGLRVALIVEELFSNSVQHGYRGDSDAPIGVAFAGTPTGVEIYYEDAAPPFDPLPAFSGGVTAPSGPAESRPVGGLGLVLIGALVDGARYARDDERNRLWLAVACRRGAGAAGA